METDINKLRETPHWSSSAFQTFLTCPLKYQFQYLDHAPVERTGVCFPFGRAFHATLSARARQGESFKATEAGELFADFFLAEVKATENLTYKANESFDTLLATGVQMLDAALTEWQDDYSVRSVAEGFSVNVPELSNPLIGEFDLVVMEGDDTRQSCIVDWKTSSTKWPIGKADKSLQATAFCYAFNKLYGTSPLFRFDVVTKAKTPTVSNYYTLRVQNELERFEHLANRIDQSVKAGVFYPNESIMNCSDCPFMDRCKKWRGK